MSCVELPYRVFVDIYLLQILLLPAKEVCEGNVFTSVCHSLHKRGGGVLRLAPGQQAGVTRGVYTPQLVNKRCYAPSAVGPFFHKC